VKVHNELNAILLRAWIEMKMGEHNGLCIMNSEQLKTITVNIIAVLSV